MPDKENQKPSNEPVEGLSAEIEVNTSAPDEEGMSAAQEPGPEAPPESGGSESSSTVEPTTTSEEITHIQAPAAEPPKPAKKSKRGLILYATIAVANCLILAGTIILLKSPQKHAAASQPLPATITKKTEAPAAKTEVITTKHYTSDALKLEFDYPSDWRISSNPDNTFMTIQSAPFSVKQTDGTVSDARAKITIYAKYPESANDVSNNSVITATSDKLTYKNPTKAQRTDTYLSYSRQAAVNGSSTVTASFISGDLSYKTADLVGSKNYRKTNPFIVFKLSTCDELCAQSDDIVSVKVDDLKQYQAFSTVKDIITSMRFN